MRSASWREIKKEKQRKDTTKWICRNVCCLPALLSISHGSGPVGYSWRARCNLSPPGSAWINAMIKPGTFSFQIPLKTAITLCKQGDWKWSCSVAKLSAFAFSSQLQASHPKAKQQGKENKSSQPNPAINFQSINPKQVNRFTAV